MSNNDDDDVICMTSIIAVSFKLPLNVWEKSESFALLESGCPGEISIEWLRYCVG